jgi:ABC transporter substrate binding protein
VDGLREHGWDEGRNLILEGRFAGHDPTRYPELAAELVALKVDAIIAGDTQAIEAARRQTTTIPIIMLFTSDPVRSGFVASLARPGGNVTGLSGQYESLAGKTLELLKEISPTINRIGIIFSPDNIGSAATAKEQQEKMAPSLGGFGSADGGRSCRHDDVDFKLDEFCRQLGQLFESPISEPPNEFDVRFFNIAEVVEAESQLLPPMPHPGLSGRTQNADPREMPDAVHFASLGGR